MLDSENNRNRLNRQQQGKEKWGLMANTRGLSTLGRGIAVRIFSAFFLIFLHSSAFFFQNSLLATKIHWKALRYFWILFYGTSGFEGDDIWPNFYGNSYYWCLIFSAVFCPGLGLAIFDAHSPDHCLGKVAIFFQI